MSKQPNVSRQPPVKKSSNVVKPKKADKTDDQTGKPLENVKAEKTQEDKGEKATPAIKKSSQLLLTKPQGSKYLGAVQPINKGGEKGKTKDDDGGGFDPQATAAILALPDADSLRQKKDKEINERKKEQNKDKKGQEGMKVEIIESDEDDLPLKEAFGDTPSEKDPQPKKK